MCETAEGEHVATAFVPGNRRPAAVSIDALSHVAEFLASEPEVRRTATGFVGYGATASGHRVLIAVDCEYDPVIPAAMT